jgi:hypothetical protein
MEHMHTKSFPRSLAAASLLALSFIAKGQSSEQLLRLTNRATTDAERTELIARGSNNPQLRAGLNRVLPSMLNSAPNDAVMESEAKLAGALRLESTTPALVSLLSHPISMVSDMYASYELIDDPIARALYEIGPPALPALAEALKSHTYLQRTRAMQVLVLTNTDQSRAILQAHLPSEPDAHLRDYLRFHLTSQAQQSAHAKHP